MYYREKGGISINILALAFIAVIGASLFFQVSELDNDERIDMDLSMNHDREDDV